MGRGDTLYESLTLLIIVLTIRACETHKEVELFNSLQDRVYRENKLHRSQRVNNINYNVTNTNIYIPQDRMYYKN